MVFSSNLFLFLFLPVSLAAYHFTPSRWKNHALFGLSALFYVWSSGSFLFVFFGSILLNYGLGALLARGKPGRKRQVVLLGVGVAANLTLLFYYKYFGFFAHELGVKLEHAIWLPVGISFFTFQNISYLVEVYRREEKPAPSLAHYAAFLACFPHLVAGPVVRYSDISGELKKRSVDIGMLYEGALRFGFGLAKKVLIANKLGAAADAIFKVPPAELSTGIAWLGALLYAFQIFFDFSGYSDMAVGLARFFGFHFPENFNQPYAARSVTDFWRRWHMSLSRWFRDFLYIPLGGNRRGGLRTYVNLFAVFALCGLWHGAAWTFVFWGLYHGVLLVAERVLKERWKFEPRGIWGQALTFLLVLVGWVFFRAESIGQAGLFLSHMAGFGEGVARAFTWRFFLTPDVSFTLAVAAALAFPTREAWTARAPKESVARAWVEGLAVAALFVLSASSLTKESFNPFIYFRF